MEFQGNKQREKERQRGEVGRDKGHSYTGEVRVDDKFFTF